jgi:hypothetical protein
MPRARAKLKGWYEELTVEQSFDLDSFEPPEEGNLWVEGELEKYPSIYAPGGYWLKIDGQSIDLDTLEMLDDAENASGSNNGNPASS